MFKKLTKILNFILIVSVIIHDTHNFEVLKEHQFSLYSMEKGTNQVGICIHLLEIQLQKTLVKENDTIKIAASSIPENQ